MALVTMKEMLCEARSKKYAVGAFEFWSLDSAQAVVEAANETGMPVILQAGPLEAEFCGGFKAMRVIAALAAAPAWVPVALHLDHAEDFRSVEDALEAGFTSVMIDASSATFDENIAITIKVVEAARKYGASVEAELGKLAGNEGNVTVGDREACQTDPAEAAVFAERTGVDALAVAIGTAHGFYTFAPELNLERLGRIAAATPIPLVLHGGSGTPDEQVRSAIGAGIAKVNICTEFIAAYGRQYTTAQEQAGFKYNVPSVFGSAKDAGRKLAKHKIRLFGGLGNGND